MNRVILVGRLTKDPELRTMPSGSSVASFTLAINRNFTNQQGEREADFINCIVFNKQAENLNRYIRKGGQVGVEGRIQTRSYTATDGTKRYVTEVVCDAVHFLEPKGNGASDGYAPYDDLSPYDMPRQNQRPNPYQQPKQQPQNSPMDQIAQDYDVTDDDLPF